jgi:hypothetical protein
MLPRRRDEIGEPVEELERRELDAAARPRPRGLAAAARPDPVGGFVARQHVADSGCAAVCTVDHGEPLQRERGPGAVSQQVFETLKIARHVAVDECDPDTRIDGKPAVLPGEHVGGGVDVEQALHAEPPNHTAPHPLGERGQIGLFRSPPASSSNLALAAWSSSRILFLAIVQPSEQFSRPCVEYQNAITGAWLAQSEAPFARSLGRVSYDRLPKPYQSCDG